MTKNTYAAILGLKPSKGARSPKLWNKTYKKLGINCRMIPLDIKKKSFGKKFKKLIDDKNFIGGAITIPFKEKILNFLKKNYDEKVKKIGAINCILRDKKSKLYGTNTDGEAALISFNKNSTRKKIKNFAILGYGGVGKAVTTYFADYYKKSKFFIYVRKKNLKNYKNVTFHNWNKINNSLEKFDALINCTSVGFMNSRSPLDYNQIIRLKKKIVIFDVIYQPVTTELMKLAKRRKIKTFNGIDMNLEQAALAFKKTNYLKLSTNKIKKIMR